MSKYHTTRKSKYNRTYLRKGEHSFVLISIFLTRVKYKGWTNGRIRKVLSEAKSRNYEHLYNVLKENLDKENI